MATLPDTDDHKNNTLSDKKQLINISQFESKLQFENTHQNNSKSPPSIRKKKRKNKKCNDINAILQHEPTKKDKEKQPVLPLTKICLEVIYQNLLQYESFDFLPEDVAAELLVMVVDRGALTRDTARPFLNTKHALIKQFCSKHIQLWRLPAQVKYGCKGFDS
eukprot:54466_1